MSDEKYFFSYTRDDSEFVLRLAKDLRDAGISLWIDQLDILAGQRWDRSVEAALKSCPGVLVVLSQASLASNNVMDEVSYALEEEKMVVPILAQPCEIPFRLRRVQYTDFTEGYENGFAHLMKSLGVERPVRPASAGHRSPVTSQDGSPAETKNTSPSTSQHSAPPHETARPASKPKERPATPTSAAKQPTGPTAAPARNLTTNPQPVPSRSIVTLTMGLVGAAGGTAVMFMLGYSREWYWGTIIVGASGAIGAHIGRQKAVQFWLLGFVIGFGLWMFLLDNDPARGAVFGGSLGGLFGTILARSRAKFRKG